MTKITLGDIYTHKKQHNFSIKVSKITEHYVYGNQYNSTWFSGRFNFEIDTFLELFTRCKIRNTPLWRLLND